MNRTKSYRDSLLSVLIIISWFVIVFRIFTAARDENVIIKFIWTWIITISIGIIGGLILQFYCIIKARTLTYSFMYNFAATLNLIVGSLGMLLPVVPGRPTPYLISASFVVGISMYKKIYIKTKWLTSNK